MRTLVDANVVLRYMLHDDPTQAATAEQAIREGAFLLPEVLAEVVYVLRDVYSIPKESISAQLQLLVDEVQADNPGILKAALATFGSTNIDFVDCILVSYNNHLGDKVVSFDRKQNRKLR